MSSSSAPAATFTSTWRQLRPRSIAATSPCTNPVLICLSLRRGRICSRRVELRPLADSKQATLHAEVNGDAGSPTYITLWNLSGPQPEGILRGRHRLQIGVGRFLSRTLELAWPSLLRFHS